MLADRYKLINKSTKIPNLPGEARSQWCPGIPQVHDPAFSLILEQNVTDRGYGGRVMDNKLVGEARNEIYVRTRVQ